MTKPIPTANFKNPDGGLASQTPVQNLKFERADWTSFRTVEGLQQKAGVSADKLRRLVLKELTDNGLDTGASVNVGRLPNGGYFVEDDGRRHRRDAGGYRAPVQHRPTDGFDQAVAACRRAAHLATVCAWLPVRSSHRTARLSSRRADKRIKLRPERDGSTTVVSVKPVNIPSRDKDRNQLRSRHPEGCERAALGDHRDGDGPRPVLHAASRRRGGTTPRSFTNCCQRAATCRCANWCANLDGCTGARAGEIVAEAGLSRMTCADISRKQADTLLTVARKLCAGGHAEPAWCCRSRSIPRLGLRTRRAAKCRSALNRCTPPFRSSWRLGLERAQDMAITVCVNRTPVTGDIDAARDKREIDLFGCGLSHTVAEAPKDKNFDIRLNITTPYMPITSDGKEPNLEPFFDVIRRRGVEGGAQGTTPRRQGHDAEGCCPRQPRLMSSLTSAARRAIGSTRGSCSMPCAPSSWRRPARN